jgi:DNA-binding IclR family transcriptional regulator
MSAQEIAKACSMSRPTAYRLLTTLLSRAFVQVDSHHNYSLGSKLLSLGRLVMADMSLQDAARPYLRELCSISNEMANLSVLDGNELLYIGKEESPQRADTPISVQMRSTVGTRITLHSSAMGKAILAYLPADRCHALIEATKPLKAYTSHTITDSDVLMRQLDQIRAQGYAIDDREVEEGTRCVAAPIFDRTGTVVAAMSIAGPAYRLTLDRLHLLSADVIRITQVLSAQLGYLQT